MVHYIAVNPGVCTGCRECEMVCSLYHFGQSHPERSAVRIVRNEGHGLAEPLPLVCQQCDEPPCIDACPAAALSKSVDSGRLVVDKAACTGCGECTLACPAGCIFLDGKEGTAVVCDLCGGDPQCVPLCHSQCLTLGESQAPSGEARVNHLAQALDPTGRSEGVSAEGGR
jgi:Fe-S-cluster-containing hydrogenase component 2